jgi:hypothetical protein
MKTNLFKLSLLLVAAAMLIFNGCKKDLVTPASKIPTTAPIAQAAANGKMVLFPGRGWVPGSQVHYIEQGYYILKKNGHIFKAEKGTNRIVTDFGEYKKPVLDNTADNALKFMNNGGLNRNADLKSTKKPVEFSGPNPDWIDYANWKNPKNNGPITNFSTTWKVPGAPDSLALQSIAIFNGLQDTLSYGDVIQPVLAWGPLGFDIGGNFWYLVNCYATASPTPYYFFQLPIDTVTANTSVTGVITYTGLHSPDNSYNYTSAFAGHTNNVLTLVEGTDWSTNQNPKRFAPAIPELNLACETLEAYNSNGNPPQFVKLYPHQDSVPMTNIQIKANGVYPLLTAPAWTTGASTDTIHGQKAVIVNTGNGNPSNGEVDLYFHAQQKPAISYTTPDVFTSGTTITPLSPTNTGGTPNTYSVSPVLPNGLIFNTSSGVISGMPNGGSSAANYTVTAHNAAGNGTFVVNITVNTTIAVTFDVNSSNNSENNFMIFVDGNNISGDRGVSQPSGTAVVTDETLVADSHATVVMQIMFGPMPTSATLYNFGAPINGVISGSNITFTNINLSAPITGTLNIN